MPISLRRSARHSTVTLLALLILLGTLLATARAVAARDHTPDPIRFATFNASLNRNAAGQALADLSTPGNAQAAAVAEIIQRVQPDVLLINEFDYVDGPIGGNAMTDAFQANYLSVPQKPELDGIEYPYVFVAPSNTGIPSGKDFSNDGTVGGPNDAFGFGFFPGQFGMAVFSKYPIRYNQVRTFQEFLWKDMPGALIPDNPATSAPADWYSPDELDVFRLSSKSHWDVPIRIGNRTVHFLASHPTPPVFDDPPQFPAGVDFNGRRNFDEIRIWADYITGGSAASYIYDDHGRRGGLSRGAEFVIAGDQNSDPLDGDSIPGAIQQLLDNQRVNTSQTPASLGGPYWADVQNELNDTHRSDPAFDTADFCDFAPRSEPPFPPCTGPGNLRADYVLPSSGLGIADAGIFWPTGTDPLLYLTGTGFPVPSSDHRLVWVDVVIRHGDKAGG